MPLTSLTLAITERLNRDDALKALQKFKGSTFFLFQQVLKQQQRTL